MFRSKLAVSILAVSASFTGVASAQAPAASAQAPAASAQAPAASLSPTTAPALRSPAPALATIMKPYEGEWMCDTAFVAGAWGPGKPETKTKGTFKLRRTMGGLWYEGEWQIEKTKVLPAAIAVFVVGYDVPAKAPTMTKYDNSGTLVFATAPGATPEKTVFVGEARLGAKNAKFRDTVSVKGAKEFVHTSEMDTGKGFRLMSSETCTK